MKLTMTYNTLSEVIHDANKLFCKLVSGHQLKPAHADIKDVHICMFCGNIIEDNRNN